MARVKQLVFVPKSELHAAFVSEPLSTIINDDRLIIVAENLTKKDANTLAMAIRKGRVIVNHP